MTDPNAEYEIDSLITHASQLHSPPEIAQKLLKLTRHDDFLIRDVVECIHRDPAMSAKMLRLVNSVRYGLRTRVTNLNQTVALLGRRTVRLMALTFSIVDTLASGPARSIYNSFWRDALTMASGAARLAGRLKNVDCDDAYVAGLLADVGSLVMAQVRGDRYLSIYECCRGAALCAAEQQTFGFDHTEVGARMLQHWQFSAETVDAVRQHHRDNAAEPMAIATRGGAILAETVWTDDVDKFHRVGTGFMRTQESTRRNSQISCDTAGTR